MLGPLFDAHRHLRAVIDSVLEGYLGTAFVDSLESPRTARLELGVYVFLAGDARSPAADEFVSNQDGLCEFIVADEPDWMALIQKHHGDRIERRTMDAFSACRLDLTNLRLLSGIVPDDVELAPLTIEDARSMGPEFNPNCISIFKTPEDFLQRGLSVCAKQNGSILAAATSYSISANSVEVAIATHPDHRRRGLASAVGAAILIQCIERGLEPHWNAGNPISSSVANKLGFTPDGSVSLLYLNT